MPPIPKDGGDAGAIGEPLQIISMDESGTKFDLNMENLAAILGSEPIKGLPAVVVSLAGKTRGGKSFLLNYFLAYLDDVANEKCSPTLDEKGLEVTDPWLDSMTPPSKEGFNWSHGDERHTTGIWMYSKPIIRTVKGGKKVAVLLVDTQGTFDNKTAPHTNAMVFAMNSLISSMQIYNVSGGLITEDVLQHMHMFTKFGEMAHDKQESGEDGAIKPFQKIMFLVRDWGSPKNHAFGAAGGDAYFNKVLSTSADDAPQELKEVRRDLRKAFSELECYLMPRPGDGIAEGEDDAEITPRFNAHLNTLVPSILKAENLVIKEMLGREVTCGDLIQQIKAYSTVFSSGKLPEISSVFDATAELNHERLVMAAIDGYAKSMDSYAGVKAPYREPETLEIKHKEAMAKAVASYAEAPRLSHARIEAKCSAELKTKVEKKYAEICASNESKALLTVLKTPITFGGLALASNIVGTFLSLIGLSSIATLLSYLTWFCLLTCAFWAYSTNTGNFGDVTVEIDQYAKVVYDMGMQIGLTYMAGGLHMPGKKDN